jgi:phosphoglycerate dehydrogenase-like enzyme
LKILVTNPIGYERDSFLDAETCERLNKLGEVEYNTTERHFTREELKAKLADKDILLTGWGTPKLDSELLRGSSVKLVAHTGGSVSLLLHMSVYDLGIKVASGNRYYAESVAEGTLAYILFALRKLDYFAAEVKKGEWPINAAAYNEGLLDQTVGVISLGAISRNLINMGKVFRIKFKVYSHRPNPETAKELGFEYASLEEIFSTCKVITLHTAQNAETYHMIDMPLLKLMRDGTVFINTSRGSVVNEAALIEELKTGRFSAVLDVYDVEPLPQNSPLLKLDNVSLFPHQGGPTLDRRRIVGEKMTDDIERFINGKPLLDQIPRHIAEEMTT